MLGACGSDGTRPDSDGATLTPPPPDAGTAVACAFGQVCLTSHCRLTVPAALGVPVGLTVTLDEGSVPSGAASDTIEPWMCTIALPAALAVTTPLRLAVLTSAPRADGVAVRLDDRAEATAVEGSTASSDAVEALVTAGGRYALTARNPGWKIVSTLTNDPLASNDLASLLRNVSLQTINAAHFDGTRLFLGDGPRVLVWNGMPPDAATKPAFVLGQPDLNTIVSGISQATVAGTVSGLWGDARRLVLTEANRALVWSTPPQASYAPADLVLGQQDFVSAPANAGGISASTLSQPRGVTSDGTKLAIADLANARVLLWDSFPTRIGEPATSVLGPASFTTVNFAAMEQPYGVVFDGAGAFVATALSGVKHFPSTATGTPTNYAAIQWLGPARVQRDALFGASSIARLPGGGLAMASSQVPRIAIQKQRPTSEGTADFVLGQPEPDRAVAGTVSASSLTGNARIAAGNGVFIVPDGSRALVYDHTPAFNFDPADRVLGQAGFSVNDRGTDYRRISDRTLAYPADVATNDAVIAVADTGNNRVLLYPANGGPAVNAPATVVLGQASAVTFGANGDQRSTGASTLSGPEGVAIDANRLVVADTENHRVLVWSPVPTTTGAPATIVLGQADFAAHRPNRGAGDADGDGFSDASANGMFYPTGVAMDATHLFVADRQNNRVLVWDDVAGLTTGRPADRVLGQPGFGSVAANRGAGAAPRFDGFSYPTGIALQGDSLLVADTENNRIVRWDGVRTGGGAPAAVVGQTSGTALVNPNAFPQTEPNAGFPIIALPTPTTVVRPRGVTVGSGKLYITERDTHRMHVFTRSADDYTTAGVIGQPSETAGSVNGGGLGAGSFSSPAGLTARGNELFVADAANHRVLRFGSLPTPGGAAAAVIGQTSFVSNGFDQSVPFTGGGSTRPSGMAVSQGELLVAERGQNRVVIHDLPLVGGRQPKRILGQTDVTGRLPNAGGAATASSLAGPSAVFADEQRIVVADSDNNRVLVYPRDVGAAAIVLGQADFTSTKANRDGAAADTTLARPAGVYADSSRLVVADAGNHRVLVWTTFPTSNGQPADIVIGQASFAGSEPNGGSGVASATTLASPAAVLIEGGALYIADTGNNRVLVFASIPVAPGTPASRVLGQSSFTSRIPAVNALDPVLLSGPVALASDGTNLYVADRDANRIIAYSTTTTAGNGVAATQLFGAMNGLSAIGPSGLAVERTPFFTSRLYLADTHRDQLLILEGLSRVR